MLKVAQVCPRFFPNIGGIETHVQEIGSRLAESGVDLEVLTTDPSGRLINQEEVLRMKIRRFRSWAPSDAYFFSSDLRHFLKKHFIDYDLVHAHSYSAFPAVYAGFAKVDERPLVFTPHYHGGGHSLLRNLLHIPYRIVAKKVLDKSNAIVCVSDYESKLLQSKLGVAPEKIRVVPNGLNLSEFRFHREEIKSKPKTVLYVGRLERYKRVDVVIKAMKFFEQAVSLKVIGQGQDEHRLHDVVNKLHLDGSVMFSSSLPREKLLEEYAKSDVFVTLSKHEAYGITVAEALASGTPCVVANNSALEEWIDGNNCVGVDNADDPEKVAMAIKQVMDRKVVGFITMDWDQVAAKTLDVYKTVLR
jgi:glycosyltransferase involved in cell wall biosynthesis